MSCVYFGRTCYAPLDKSRIGWPRDFYESNYALVKSMNHGRTRWLWMTRLILVMLVDPEQQESSPWSVCFYFFVIEFFYAISVYSEKSQVSSNSFTDAILVALLKNWETLPETVRQPFQGLNGLFEMGAELGLRDLARSPLESRSIIATSPKTEPCSVMYWEDSVEGMKAVASRKLESEEDIKSEIGESRSICSQFSSKSLPSNLGVPSSFENRWSPERTSERVMEPDVEHPPVQFQNVLFNVRGLIDRVRRTLNTTTQNGVLRPPGTERHKTSNKHQPGASASRHDARAIRGSFTEVADDVIRRYAKFLRQQHEQDMCSQSKEVRRRSLYIHSLSEPITVRAVKSQIGTNVDGLTAIGLFGTFPFLRYLRLLMNLTQLKRPLKVLDLERLPKITEMINNAGIGPNNPLNKDTVIGMFKLLIAGTPLESLNAIFEPDKKDHQDVGHIFEDLVEIINQSWLLRVPTKIQPVKEDASLLKNPGSRLQPYVVPHNR